MISTQLLLPDEYSDQNLKMKRRDFCLEFFCQFFGWGLPSTKLQAKVFLLFLILKLLWMFQNFIAFPWPHFTLNPCFAFSKNWFEHEFQKNSLLFHFLENETILRFHLFKLHLPTLVYWHYLDFFVNSYYIFKYSLYFQKH